MSGETFEVGEVAIYHKPTSCFSGTEVTVVGPLEVRRVWRDGPTSMLSYQVDADFGRPPPNGVGWAVEPHRLRKRRPPQDWIRLCRLTESPVEELVEELV
jgi:hypothetical protein